MKKYVIAIAVLLAFGLVAPTRASSVHYVEDFSSGIAGMPGIAGDGVADNAPIMAAIAAAAADGGEIVLRGVYEVQSNAANLALGNPYRYLGVYIQDNERAIRITAQGEAGFKAIGNWYDGTGYLFTIYKNKAPVFLDGVRFDMSGRTSGFDEQQHALELDVGAHDVHAQNLVFYHPDLDPLNGSAGGDCVRLLGGYTVADIVYNVTFDNTTFLACDRSAFGFQRAVHFVTVRHFASKGNPDNDLDMEATGTLPWTQDPMGITRIKDVKIYNANIEKQGGTCITMGKGDRLGVYDSYCHGGGIFVLSCNDCEVAGSTFEGLGNGTDALVTFRRASFRNRLRNSRLTRIAPVSATSGPLLSITADPNDGAPTDIEVSGNDLFQQASTVGAVVRSSGVRFHDNILRYAGPTPANANAVAVVIESVGAGTTVPNPPARGTFTGNMVLGPWHSAVTVSPDASPMLEVGPWIFYGNTLDGPTRAIRCINWATWGSMFRGIVRNGNYVSAAGADECPIATTGS